MATVTQDLAQENAVYKTIALELHGRNYTDWRMKNSWINEMNKYIINK